MTPSVLFITRKYPPARGGMEEFSHRLVDAYPGPARLIALRRGQRWLPWFILEALAGARRERREVELVHLGDGMLAALAPLIGRLTGLPVAVTVHGQEITRELPGYAWTVGRGLRWQPGGVIAVSSYTAEQARQRHGVAPTVITNGVDVGRFGRLTRSPDTRGERSRLGIPVDGPLLVTVGRLVERKGAAWFIANVLPRLGEDAVYVVIGSGPDAAAVRETAARATRRVVLFESAPDATVDDILRCADLFVAPNIAVPGKPEGYGIAPAEGAAAGLPVAVSDIEGLHDMAADTGVTLAPPGDAQAWAAVVHGALRDPATARASRPARSWDAAAADYARLFNGLRSMG